MQSMGNGHCYLGKLCDGLNSIGRQQVVHQEEVIRGNKHMTGATDFLKRR